jgi:TRAP-type C4-dicarboxylate transport system permease small subunit
MIGISRNSSLTCFDSSGSNTKKVRIIDVIISAVTMLAAVVLPIFTRCSQATSPSDR